MDPILGGLIGALIGALALVAGQFFGPVYLDGQRRKRDRLDEARADRKAGVLAIRRALHAMSQPVLSTESETGQYVSTIRVLVDSISSLSLGIGPEADHSLQQSLMERVRTADSVGGTHDVWRIVSVGFYRLDALIDEPQRCLAAAAEIKAEIDDRLEERRLWLSKPTWERAAERALRMHEEEQRKADER